MKGRLGSFLGHWAADVIDGTSKGRLVSFSVPPVRQVCNLLIEWASDIITCSSKVRLLSSDGAITGLITTEFRLCIQETSARYGRVEPSNGSNDIPRRARPGLPGLGPHTSSVTLQGRLMSFMGY